MPAPTIKAPKSHLQSRKMQMGANIGFQTSFFSIVKIQGDNTGAADAAK
jgi:hypothetical protein